MAQVFGLELSVIDYLLTTFVPVVGSAATAGLTGALVMLTLTLSTFGLPLAGAGLLLATREKILDLDRHHSPRSAVLAGGHATLDHAAARPTVPATA